MPPKAPLAILTLALLGATPAYAGEAMWTVAESSGSVSLFVKGRAGPAVPGEAVPADAAVLTGRDGHAVLARGADRVELTANGRLHFRAGSGVFADRGRTTIMSAGGAVVATPYLRAEGGRFSVTVGEGGATVLPGAGRVDVATIGGEARQMVEPGMVAIVGADRMDRLVIDGTARTLVGTARTDLPTVATRSDGAVDIAGM